MKMKPSRKENKLTSATAAVTLCYKPSSTLNN